MSLHFRLTASRFAPRHGGVLKVLIGTILVVAVALGGLTVYAIKSSTTASTKVVITDVKTAPFEHAVVEEGEVESADNVEITCNVKSEGRGGTEILEVVPEGTVVKAGEVVVQLDDSVMQLELIQQRVVCNNKEASWIQAKNAVEAAEIARLEYLEGTFKQEEQLLLSEIFIAEENLRRAELSVQSSERLAARGLVTPLQLEADRFAVEKARNELNTGNTKLRVLRQYTKAKMLKQFDSDIASAKALEASEEASFELEEKKREAIETQIEGCKIRAPKDGQIVHANIFDSRGDNEFIVQPGTAVREGQVILRMPDPDQMQVTTKIKEAQISLVRPGLPCLIKVDGQPGPAMLGYVETVSEYPEPTSRWSSNIKRYKTTVLIESPPKDLLVGRTAQVRILVEQQPKAIQIPVQSVTRKGGRNWVLVKSGEGWETREVEVGSSNEKTVLVKSGVTEGDQIALNAVTTERLYEFPEGIETSDSDAIVQNFAPRPGASRGGPPGGGPGSGRPGGAGFGEGGRGPGAGGRPGGGRPGGIGQPVAGEGPSSRDGEFKPPAGNTNSDGSSPTTSNEVGDSSDTLETRTATAPTTTTGAE